LQAYAAPGGLPLDTPNYLTLVSRDAASLQGTHIHVVGHPEGRLKKWSEGQVVDSDGTWVWFNAYSLPGNSGSPVLDDQGHMVGILHRGPTAQDLFSNRGVDEFAIGTASAALVTGMGKPLPAATRSLTAAATDAEVVAHPFVYLNAQRPQAMVNGAPKDVLSSLGEACDVGLARQDYASPDDLATALAPCTRAEFWIECRGDVPARFGVCPANGSLWLARLQGVYDHWRALNGELSLYEVSFGVAALSSSKSTGRIAAAQKLGQALADANPPLDFRIANYLAAFNVDTYRGTRVLDFLHAYTSVPDYALSGTSIANTALWLNGDSVLTWPDTLSLLRALAGDDKIDIGTKLFIEDVRYQSKALD
jgi:hypothetical protein